ncbi:TatD family hydrolase, partial [Actinotignum timonense]|nr:TatD family hydrolase [Actinotignum timonense]
APGTLSIIGAPGSGKTTVLAHIARAAFQAFDPVLLLAETDAPYLTPVPWRGHPNAPYVMAWTVRFGAELRGVNEADWCAQLLKNTRAVYGELGAA